MNTMFKGDLKIDNRWDFANLQLLSLEELQQWFLNVRSRLLSLRVLLLDPCL